MGRQLKLICLPISPKQGFATWQTNLSAGEMAAATPTPGDKKHLGR